MRDTHRLRPVLVAEGAIRTDTQDLGIRRLEVLDALVEGGHALRSARGPVEGVEQEHHVLALIVLQADLLEPDGLHGERGRSVPDLQSLLVAHSGAPPFARRMSRLASIISEPRRPFNRAGMLAAGFRLRAHRLRRLDSSAVSSSPRKAAAVTTRPVSQRDRKRSA